MTDEEALAFASKAKAGARPPILDLYEWVIAKATEGRLITQPHGARAVRDRRGYMQKWRAKKRDEIERLKARAPAPAGTEGG